MVVSVCKSVRHPRGMEFGDWVQIGMLGLLRAIERYDPSRGTPFEYFARSSVRWALMDELRKEKAPRELLFSELEDEPEEVTETGLEDRLVDKQFWKQIFHHVLSAKERRIVKLRIWEEMSFREIAADVGLSHTQCQSIFDQSLTKLKKYLEGQGFDHGLLDKFA